MKNKHTTIYLVRHGEVHNPQQVLYGRLPGFGLSKRGQEQARTLGLKLHGKKISKIYASPLERAQETAKLAGEVFGISEVVSDMRLLEVDMPFAGISMRKFMAMGNTYKEKFFAQGMERPETMAARMQAFLQDILKLHQGQKILAVSHGDPITAAFAKLTGIPLIGETFDEHLPMHTHGVQFEFDNHGKVRAATKFHY